MYSKDTKSIQHAAEAMEMPMKFAFSYVVLTDLAYPVAAFLMTEDAEKYLKENDGMGFRLVEIRG